MPRGQQERPARAVVRAQDAPQQDNGPQRALVSVTREIDNRLAIVGASSAAGIDPQRLKLVALGAFTRTPALWTCDPVSVARSIVEAGQLGLEPTGLLGGAYLVPRGGQCTLLVGYRGLVMLAMRSGLVQRVEARVVREKDVFEYGYGLEPYLRHLPSTEADPGPYTGAYAVLFYRDGSRQFDYMSIAEIEAVRKRSAAKDAGPWVTDYAEMCKKTPLRRLMKMAPLTIEVASKLDELDPEVPEQAPSGGDARQAELRRNLQQALEAEYGGAPAPQQQPATEGQYREVDTTDGAAAGAQGEAQAKGAQAPQAEAKPASRAPAGEEERQAGAQQRRSSEPESAGQVMGTEPACGASDERMGVGPCVLPASHQRKMYVVGGTTYPPQQEHEEAGGARWSQRR